MVAKLSDAIDAKIMTLTVSAGSKLWGEFPLLNFTANCRLNLELIQL